ncbi:class I SAM-dependent methyltransferase [Streptomyces sp. NPDC012888]|uniref:class I SAM-dependent methyltransferase n=1 Tax=Streptomyces sp. NPDC012888 TaxID=3364855 RepID=UPI0036941624
MTPVPHGRWVSGAAFLALAAGTARARRRLHALAVLPAPPAGGPAEDSGRYRLVAAEGVLAGPDVLRAARAHAEREGLEVLELLPEDLDAERALGLLRLLDPAAYRRDRLACGRGAGTALLATAEVLARAGIDPDGRRGAPELLGLTRRLKEYAAGTTDLAVAPGLRAPAPGPGADGGLEELYAQGLPPGPLAAARLAGLALLAAGAVRHGRWGLAAAALYWAQPWLVLGPGGPLRPAGLGRATAARPVRSLHGALRTAVAARAVAAARRSAGPDAVRAAWYAAELAAGTDRFFEPRRADCPWCGAGGLRVRVRVPDLLQGKPGRFVLEECEACGHVFQNPRLTPAGLDFYYRDFYDGRGGEGAGAVFGRLGGHYRARAAMLAPHATPSSWLDVGTGHGHFCAAARDVWPETRFDGLDMGDGVEEAERRGWVRAGYRGQFPELAAKLAGQYDAVSMYHYLEHTRDPRAELRAAAEVLVPGGHLLVELPDPQSRTARLLGPHWLPWFQPQHQHLVPAANLREALAECGFTVLAEEHGPAHQHNDFVGALVLTVNRLAPDPDSPWAAATGPAVRAVRQAVRAAALPCFPVAAALDVLRTAAARATDGGNAYRLLARREPDGPDRPHRTARPDARDLPSRRPRRPRRPRQPRKDGGPRP